jgi:capsular exopolysaccharide synthesis family protein
MQDNKLVVMTSPDSMISESYRLLSTNLQHSSLDRDVKIILVTSASPGEGKTTIVANLAVTYGQENKKVLLIDANLRKPMLHELFLNRNTIGLTNILNNMIQLDDEVMQVISENLSLIPSGPIPANPSGLFASSSLIKLLEEVKNNFDVILIDCPSVLSLADVPMLAAKCDGVLMVIDSKKGKKRLVKKAMSKLRHVHANVIGAVINNKKDQVEEVNGYYYYHSVK